MGRRQVLRTVLDLWNCALLHASCIGRLLYPKYTMTTQCDVMPQIDSVHAFSRALLNQASMSYDRADGNQPAASGDLPNASPNILQRQQLNPRCETSAFRRNVRHACLIAALLRAAPKTFSSPTAAAIHGAHPSMRLLAQRQQRRRLLAGPGKHSMQGICIDRAKQVAEDQAYAKRRPPSPSSDDIHHMVDDRVARTQRPFNKSSKPFSCSRLQAGHMWPTRLLRVRPGPAQLCESDPTRIGRCELPKINSYRHKTTSFLLLDLNKLFRAWHVIVLRFTYAPLRRPSGGVGLPENRKLSGFSGFVPCSGRKFDANCCLPYRREYWYQGPPCEPVRILTGPSCDNSGRYTWLPNTPAGHENLDDQ